MSRTPNIGEKCWGKNNLTGSKHVGTFQGTYTDVPKGYRELYSILDKNGHAWICSEVHPIDEEPEQRGLHPMNTDKIKQIAENALENGDKLECEGPWCQGCWKDEMRKILAALSRLSAPSQGSIDRLERAWKAWTGHPEEHDEFAELAAAIRAIVAAPSAPSLSVERAVEVTRQWVAANMDHFRDTEGMSRWIRQSLPHDNSTMTSDLRSRLQAEAGDRTFTLDEVRKMVKEMVDGVTAGEELMLEGIAKKYGIEL